MRIFKHIQFSEGVQCTFAEFKKDFAAHLIRLNEKEAKEAYKIATKGNGKSETTVKKSKELNSK